MPSRAPRRAPRRAARRARPSPGMTACAAARSRRPRGRWRGSRRRAAAPIRPKAGAYGEAEPFGSSSGPRRVPRTAPTAKPAEREHADDEPPPEAQEGENALQTRRMIQSSRDICNVLPLSDRNPLNCLNSSQRLRRARPVLALAARVVRDRCDHRRAAGRLARSRSLAAAIVKAWTQGEYASMYADIDAGPETATTPASSPKL